MHKRKTSGRSTDRSGEKLVACQQTRWQRKYASTKCWLIAELRSHLDAAGNRHPNWTENQGQPVNNIPPIQQNSMKNGYDENKGYDESYETKCAMNYSIITNNKWNDTHNKQLTMHNKYTNDDVHTDDCVVHRALFHTRDDTAHLMAQVLSNHIVIFIPSMARSL